MGPERVDDAARFIERAHERDHDFDVFETHLFTDALDGATFEREALGERNVPR